MQPPAPSTALVSRRHVVEPSADTPEARLTALEEQRVYDDRVVHDLANALTALQGQAVQQASGLQALTQSGLSLRQEVFAARADVAAVATSANDAAQSAAMAQMAVSAEAKFEQLDRLTAELATGVHALGLREQRAGQVVEGKWQPWVHRKGSSLTPPPARRQDLARCFARTSRRRHAGHDQAAQLGALHDGHEHGYEEDLR